MIVNKQDLAPAWDSAALPLTADDLTPVIISATQKSGIDQIAAQIKQLFFQGIETSQTTAVVTNARQVGLLQQAQQSLADVMSGIRAQMPIDLVQIDMTNCWNTLGEITGETAPDELITQLFSQFCLGK